MGDLVEPAQPEFVHTKANGAVSSTTASRVVCIAFGSHTPHIWHDIPTQHLSSFTTLFPDTLKGPIRSSSPFTSESIKRTPVVPPTPFFLPLFLDRNVILNP